jgi:hypothetical protein
VPERRADEGVGTTTCAMRGMSAPHPTEPTTATERVGDARNLALCEGSNKSDPKAQSKIHTHTSAL